MRRNVAKFSCCFGFAFILFLPSCRYSMPVFKVAYQKDTAQIEENGQMLTHYWARYNYFRISRYGVVGYCARHYYYDSAGVLMHMNIHKMSAQVNDGYAIHHSKYKGYGPGGRLTEKRYVTLKERGWSHSQRREKKVVLLGDGKRKVIREHN